MPIFSKMAERVRGLARSRDATSGTTDEVREATKRREDLHRVRMLLERNEAKAKFFSLIAGALGAYGLLGSADLSPAEYRERVARLGRRAAEELPPERDFVWFQAERATLRHLIEYTRTADQLAVDYERRYWHQVQEAERRNAQWNQLYDNMLANGHYGPEDSVAEWARCPYVVEMKEKAEGHERAAEEEGLKEKIGRFANNILGPFSRRPKFCGVCYKCAPETRRLEQEVALKKLYGIYHDMLKVAYDRAVENVGAGEIDWRAPMEVPPKPHAQTARCMDARAMYVYKDQDLNASGMAGVNIHTIVLDSGHVTPTISSEDLLLG